MDMKTIKLPCFGITVSLVHHLPPQYDTQTVNEIFKAGAVTSELRECEHCDNEDSGCEFCHSKMLAFDVLESFILSSACAGIDIESNAFIDAIETTVDAIGNHIS